MKKILTLIATAIIALFAVSCQPTVKSVASTYQGKEVTLDYAPHSATVDPIIAIAQVALNAQILPQIYIILGEDGSAEVKLKDKAEKGIWTLTGNTIKITIDGISLEGTVKGNTLIFPLPIEDFEEMIEELSLDYLKATVTLEKK